MVGKKKLMIFFSLFVLSIFFSNTPVSAQTDYQFTSINGDEIKISSVVKQIFERIELSKKLLADLQAGKNLEQTEKQKFIEEQRKISQQKLQIQLDRMNKDYEPFTPRNAFAGYLSGVNERYHGI